MLAILERWIDAKNAEKKAIETRREIEDKLVERFGIKETDDGVKNFEFDRFDIKITSRLEHKVDRALLLEIVQENELDAHLNVLFRHKSELSLTNWKAADKSITGLFAPCITTKASRPTFAITKINEETI
jgi:hypothetical protein